MPPQSSTLRPDALLEAFAVCPRGLEPLLEAELRGLRLAGVERQVGGAYFRGRQEELWRANLELRTAVRLLWRLARFEARDGDALYAGVRSVDWSPFLGLRSSFAVSARTAESALDHSLYLEQRCKDAIVDQLRGPDGARPSVDREEPDLRVHLHLFRDRATLSIDTSGPSLHLRGWRRFQGRAPLAETLAAGVVLLSGWDRRAPFLDPFCGSGTLLVEAAQLAAGRAPGLSREGFAFEKLPGFDRARYEALREELRARTHFPPKLRLRGSDLCPLALEGARENLAAAGLEGRVEIELADARELEVKRGWNAWVVTNPPYGERVGAEAPLEGLYAALGERLRAVGAGFTLALLCGRPELGRALSLPLERRAELFNGGLPCELLLGVVPG
jgi:23S rRNA G2445 N2-methylase RlmL